MASQYPLKQDMDFSRIIECRRDFPVIAQTMNGKRLAYLDNASSAQKPNAVIHSMRETVELGYANIHRGLYGYSQELTAAYEAVRQKMADLIGADDEREIIFTRNATEGINLVAHSWGRTFLKKGDEIILSVMEHHANIVPWQLLQREIDFKIRVIPMHDNGTLDLDAYQALLNERTKFVGIVHISNALGTINPVKEIIKRAKEYNPGIIALVDGSQSIVHSTIDVTDINCDFFVMTGHKLYATTGVGALYGKYEVLVSMQPYQGGGDMIEKVNFDHAPTFKDPPFRFEAGTPPFVQVIGLGAAIDYFTSFDFDIVQRYEQSLLEYLTQSLLEIDGLKIYGQAEEKAGVVSFTIEGLQPSDVASILDQCGVAVRTGHHCCMPLMKAMGIDGTIRASLAMYSVREDIDQLIAGLHKARELLL